MAHLWLNYDKRMDAIFGWTWSIQEVADKLTESKFGPEYHEETWLSETQRAFLEIPFMELRWIYFQTPKLWNSEKLSAAV